MHQSLKLFPDDEPIRFTPEGRLFILDAIAAVVQTDTPESLWRKIKTRKPEINQHYHISDKDGDGEPVCDSHGWEAIQDMLFDYMIDENLMAAKNH